jgi:cobalamin biosynthesis Mg chelatase CobN
MIVLFLIGARAIQKNDDGAASLTSEDWTIYSDLISDITEVIEWESDNWTDSSLSVPAPVSVPTNTRKSESSSTPLSSESNKPRSSESPLPSTAHPGSSRTESPEISNESESPAGSTDDATISTPSDAKSSSSTPEPKPQSPGTPSASPITKDSTELTISPKSWESPHSIPKFESSTGPALTKTSTFTEPFTVIESSKSSDDAKSATSKSSVVIAVVVIVVILGAIVGVVVVCYWRRRKFKRAKSEEIEERADEPLLVPAEFF